jgi:hypothetical protein
MTRVVHCKREPYDVYIGRPSKWGNPFKSGRDGTLEEVLEKYGQHILSRPDLLAALHELEGKTLGCWCKPKPCHGDVLIELLVGGTAFVCRWCNKNFTSKYGKFCPHCCRFQD